MYVDVLCCRRLGTAPINRSSRIKDTNAPFIPPLYKPYQQPQEDCSLPRQSKPCTEKYDGRCDHCCTTPTPPPAPSSSHPHLPHYPENDHHDGDSSPLWRRRHSALQLGHPQRPEDQLSYPHRTTPSLIKNGRLTLLRVAGVALEEMGLSYDAHTIDIRKNVQFEPWFVLTAQLWRLWSD